MFLALVFHNTSTLKDHTEMIQNACWKSVFCEDLTEASLVCCPSGDHCIGHQVFCVPLRCWEGQMDREPAASHQTQQGTASLTPALHITASLRIRVTERLTGQMLIYTLIKTVDSKNNKIIFFYLNLIFIHFDVAILLLSFY